MTSRTALWSRVPIPLQLQPGDVILTIDGLDSKDWFAQERKRAYGATDGFSSVQRAFRTKSFFHPQMKLKSAALMEPLGSRILNELFDHRRTISTLEAPAVQGWLDDLDAEDLYYINLDGRYVEGDREPPRCTRQRVSRFGINSRYARSSGQVAAGFGMPYGFLERLIGEPFDSPKYRVPRYLGPEQIEDVHPF